MNRFFLFLFSILIISCGNPSSQKREGKGGKIYGGSLRINQVDKYVSLFPRSVSDVSSNTITTQIYSGLVRFDPGNITHLLPDIADSWSLDSTGTIYTFKLKKGVKFQDDKCFPDGKGREVKASDFKYSFQLLCTPDDDNELFESTFKGKVKGADAFYSSGGKLDLEGVKALDDYTLQITLTSRSSAFFFILASPAGYVIPHEAVEKYGNKSTVGTGAFKIENIADGKIILLKNPSYFRMDSTGNQLPFLDSVIVSFIPERMQELDAFKQGNIDMIFGLPTSAVSAIVEQQIADFKSKNPKYILSRTPELATEYYQFNLVKPPFNNIKVRQAFSYAIDRDKIISDVLNSEAFGPGICGITPPGIPGYDITAILGYHFNQEKAKKLLAEAGYPDGKNFPHVTIELNSGGGKNLNVAEEIKKQLKNVLNVDVDFLVVPFSQKLDDAKYAKAEIFRSAWIADFPSPENFLQTFYGGGVPDSLQAPSYPNSSRYKNPVFDSLFLQGVHARKMEDGFTDFMKAEQILMQDAPAIILWYEESSKLMCAYVKNYHFNPINYRNFSEVYLKQNVPAAKP